MSDTPPPNAPAADKPAPPVRRRRVRFGYVSVAIAVLLVMAIAGGVAFLLSEAGLPFVIARVVAQSHGRLSVDEPSGSLASTMRFRRLEWRSETSTTSADDVVVEWNLLALVSRHLAIRGLGASRLSITVEPSNETTPPPANLALPLDVDIDNVAVARLEWRAGPQAGQITGLQFGYRGNATEHSVRDLRLASDYGSLSGNVTLQATQPFNLAGRVAVVGDGPLAGASLDNTLSGTLSSVIVDAQGKYREASLRAHVALGPFSKPAFQSANATIEGVELASLREGLPRATLGLAIELQPRGDGFAGTFRANNAAPGRVDEERIPITAASGRYDYAGTTLTLADLAVDLQGGGRASGAGSIDVGERAAPSRWRINVRDIDLARVHASLRPTRLNGELVADVEQDRQTLSGTLSQAAIALSFAATYAERKLQITRLRADAHGGTLTGNGRIAIDPPRAFDVSLEAQRFDPSHFAAVPAGSLSATVKASGVLSPEWRTTADVSIAQGSRYAGLPVTASIRGTATQRSLSDALIDVTVGSAKLHASGRAGNVGDRMPFTLDVPRAEELTPLAGTGQRIDVQGKLQASGTLQVEPGGIGGDVALRADKLRVGSDASVDALSAKASFGPGGSAGSPRPFDARPLALDAQASRLTVGGFALDTLRANASGTLQSHKASIDAKSKFLDASAALAGGLTSATRVDTLSNARWSGQLLSLTNRGDVPLSLSAPAQIQLARGYAHVEGAKVAGSEGRAEIDELTWDQGRLATRGSFTGVRLTSIAKLAERPMPLGSTAVIGGNWSISAVPRLSGSFVVRRESGDLFGALNGDPLAPEIAFGIETFEISGTLANDALDTRLTFRSARVGSAQGTLKLGTVPGAPPGRIATNAPLEASLDADLASLAPLQPWLGTAAVVNGNVKLAMTARGTLDAPILSGNVAGDRLRIDAPQFGIYLKDGRVRARLADGAIALDEATFSGGDGHFTASGTVAARGATMGQPRTHIQWNADNFRITNRPDLRLVVAGQGTLSIEEKRLAVTGKVDIVDGRIEYDPAPPGRLGSDVVIVGRAPPPPQQSVADLPLSLDVAVNLGQKLYFAGSGLDTYLSGEVRVRTGATGRLEGRGSIQAVNGTYFAFGQKLTIDRGRLIFDGALDNPALDVVALRKNLAVEAGVEVTGTAKVPRVRITSYPPVPENEALAWLITGEGLSGGSRSDYAALSAASAALLSRGSGKPLTTEIAQSLGLDDISLRSGGIGNTAAAGQTGQVIVFGKRITDRLTIGYEQGLSLASNAVRIEYALSNTVTLRAEAGVVSGVGVYYRRTYE